MGKREIDDRFKKFGTVSFTATTKVNDFIDHLENDRVSGTRCKSCGQVYFPPRADCHACLSSDMEWFDIDGSGKLMTFSNLGFAPVGFQEDVPYRIAVLDYGEFKVFGRIASDMADTDIQIGMEMKTIVNRLADDRLNFVFEKV
ncbi:MAG: DNA-binding protein [Deltaproteobacteria bacterium]|nr:MAG: DNA-binding protein [Deltaproteobacteria bacterium]RUA01695.1 MAG: DNA-binding protein [Deltaproteobacteria bacterium]